MPRASTCPTSVDGGVEDDSYAVSLVRAVDSALDSAGQWFDGVDMAELSDPVQQAVHLVRAARTGVDQLLEAMGIESEYDEDEGEREIDWETIEGIELAARAADMGWSTKPWSDVQLPVQLHPAQWKSACLIVDGDGSTKRTSAACRSRSPTGRTRRRTGSLPRPSRSESTSASDADKMSAAQRLSVVLYGKMEESRYREASSRSPDRATVRGGGQSALEAEEREAREFLDELVEVRLAGVARRYHRPGEDPGLASRCQCTVRTTAPASTGF